MGRFAGCGPVKRTRETVAEEISESQKNTITERYIDVEGVPGAGLRPTLVAMWLECNRRSSKACARERSWLGAFFVVMSLQLHAPGCVGPDSGRG